jgi:hypothetical protein
VGLFCVPDQHIWTVLDTHLLAIGLNYPGRVVEEIISIDDRDSYLSGFQLTSVSSQCRANLVAFYQEVENAAKLIIASFGRHEVVESSDLV